MRMREVKLSRWWAPRLVGEGWMLSSCRGLHTPPSGAEAPALGTALKEPFPSAPPTPLHFLARPSFSSWAAGLLAELAFHAHQKKPQSNPGPRHSLGWWKCCCLQQPMAPWVREYEGILAADRPLAFLHRGVYGDGTRALPRKRSAKHLACRYDEASSGSGHEGAAPEPNKISHSGCALPRDDGAPTEPAAAHQAAPVVSSDDRQQ